MNECYCLPYTFAVLVQGIAIVTRLAALTVWSHSIVKATETFSCGAVAGVGIIRVDVVVARTLSAVGTWQRQVAIETRTASIAVWP